MGEIMKNDTNDFITLAIQFILLVGSLAIAIAFFIFSGKLFFMHVDSLVFQTLAIAGGFIVGFVAVGFLVIFGIVFFVIFIDKDR